MFQLTEEQELMRQSLAGYLRGIQNWHQAWSPAVWRDFAATLGILSAPFAEDAGGAGGGPVETMLIMRAFGEHLVVQPYVQTLVMAGGALATSAEPAHAALLHAAIAGETVLAVAGRVMRPDGVNVAVVNATHQGDITWLNGQVTMIEAAPWASHILVAAQDGAAESLFLLPTGRPGVTLSPCNTIDGGAAADIGFENVQVTAADLLGTAGSARPVLEGMEAAAAAASCAEAVGLMHAMLALTTEYILQRQQFGKPLASFQVLRHRIVEMHARIVHAESLAHAAALAVANGAADRMPIVSAAKVQVNGALNFVARNAVQLHGAIGMMAETPVAQYFKRAVVLQRQGGDAAAHLARFADRAGITLPGEDGDIVARLAGPADAETDMFRATVRNFISENFDAGLRASAVWDASSFAEPETSGPWLRRLAARGWAAPSWPVEHGGTGWSARQRQIFELELELAGTPRLPAMGLHMCGPVIMRFGTQAQKDFFLPRILSGAHYWCQGYSEPGAGSDLASLRLAAIRDGEDYVLNGSKIWTTHAQHANWMFVLARTSREGKPQAGISFLLVPMETPGLVVRPITSISGEHEVNQVFFDNVRVPVGNLVGEENAGWQVAKYLLEFERGVGHQVPALLKALIALRALARQPSVDAGGIWEDAGFRRRFAELEIAVLATRLTEERLVYARPAGESVGDATASLLKLSWSELAQEIEELTLEALGPYAAADQAPAFAAHDEAKRVGPVEALAVTRRYLNDRVLTIAGGSSEIQRDILARLILRA